MTDSSAPQPAMTPPSPALLKILSQVLSGDATLEELKAALLANETLLKSRQSSSTDSMIDDLMNVSSVSSESDLNSTPEGQTHVISGANVDLGRQKRCGFGEVIYGEGKSVELVKEIIRTQLAQGQDALVTRIADFEAIEICNSFEFARHNPISRTLRVSAENLTPVESLSSADAETRLHVAVVTAGSTDQFVAEETLETLNWMGISHTRFEDIGVAGPQRLLHALPEIRKASAVVVAAGMEGALPAVIGGHLSVPIFAVPTSVGYGANFGGLSALLTMLNTCASSVAVVNIDSGFKGGYLAGLVVKQLLDMKNRLTKDLNVL